MKLLNMICRALGIIARFCMFCGRFLGASLARGATGEAARSGVCWPLCDKKNWKD